jgi:hypothetical protein
VQILELLKQYRGKVFDISAALFIAAFLLTGIITLPNYGVSWDEGLGNLFFGERYFNYLTTFDSKYLDFNNPDLGIHKRALNLYISPFRLSPHEFPPFADTLSGMTMEILAYRLHLLDPIDAFHIMKVFLCGAFLWILYAFAKPRFGSACAFLAIFFLGSFPRFWGDMHFNPKDIPETIFFSLTLIAFYLWFEKPSRKRALAAGILFGLSLSIKANALFLPIIIGLVFLPWLFVHRPWKAILMDFRKYQYHFILMISSAFFVHIVSWPYLYANPMRLIGYYTYIFSQGGRNVSGWNIDPLIQTITTMPETMLALLIIGFIFACSRIRSGKSPEAISKLRLGQASPSIFTPFSGVEGFACQNRFLSFEITSPILIMLVVWTLFPIFRNSLPGMANFDGIRHFQEFLPGACLLAAYGGGCLFMYLKKHTPERWAILASIPFFLIIANIASIYIRYSPYEYLYYNSLVGGISGANHEYRFSEATDYWGVSYRNGIKWLNENSEPGSVLYPPIAWWCIVIPEHIWFRDDMKTIQLDAIRKSVGSGHSTYAMFVTRKSWRDPVAIYCEKNLSPVHEIVVQGLPILKIYRLPSSIADPSK